LIWFTVFAVLLIPIFGAIWMVSNEQPKTIDSVGIGYQDKIKELAERGYPEAELKMGLRHTSIAENLGNGAIAKWCDWHGSQLAGVSPAIAL